MRMPTVAIALIGATACSSSSREPAMQPGAKDSGAIDAGGQASPPDAQGGDGESATGGDAGQTYYDAGLVLGSWTNPCPSTANDAGTVVDFTWPDNTKIDGYNQYENQTLHFTWSDGKPHNILELPLWGGQSAPLTEYANADWPNELYSGNASVGGTFDWNLGDFPCGWRPGLYYIADENNASTEITAIDLSVPEATSLGAPAAYFVPKPCSELSSSNTYGGRYAYYANRPKCTQYEVNNFQTTSGYDFVAPTFAANQGDLVLVRWTGLHNVIQVHDQSQDEPFTNGGIGSGPRTNCVGGPNYTCVNGPTDMGEYMIDTANYRPGYIHLSDQCAYTGCDGCRTACDPTKAAYNVMGYGTSFQIFLQRPVRPTTPVAGACCAIDRSKGQACRLVDVYNDNDGTQFDTGLGGGVTVNRGDLVRFRWAGSVKIVQTQTTTANLGTGVQPNPPVTMPGGVAMPGSVECVPGPNWTCLTGNTDQAQFVFDVDAAMQAGHYQTFSYGGDFFEFYAFADNSDDPYKTTQDSAVLLPVGQTTAYANNPACP